jgi:hypothetical protein
MGVLEIKTFKNHSTRVIEKEKRGGSVGVAERRKGKVLEYRRDKKRKRKPAGQGGLN